MTANRSMPGGSTSRRDSAASLLSFGSRSEPRTRQARDSGTLTVKMARQPPTPMRKPPSVGPITDTVCADTASAVRTPAGLSLPVRSASLRVSCIAAGYAAEVPNPSRTRAAISTPSDGARAPITPATPTRAVPMR